MFILQPQPQNARKDSNLYHTDRKKENSRLFIFDKTNFWAYLCVKRVELSLKSKEFLLKPKK